MNPNTKVICSKCGKAEEYHRARSQGWLVALRKGSDWKMVIRCPKCVTPYAKKIAVK
jgi:predicted nucleic-acid-binding Zn-ribbon protein